MKPLYKKHSQPVAAEKAVSRTSLSRRNFIAFGTFAGLYAVAYGGWRLLYKASEETAGVTAGARKPLRKALNQNELFFRRIFNRNHRVKTYPLSAAAKNVRQNGDLGLETTFDPAAWWLTVKKQHGQSYIFTLDQLKKLPKTEIVFDFKCVEGWDQIQHWGGVSFSDFVKLLGLEDQISTQYVGLATPDGKYYVGIDMPSALHNQTILAYEMNGKPIPLDHGYPLRLIIPVKYGIKNLKRIGSITFSNTRPPDYWAEQGYDYYSGL